MFESATSSATTEVLAAMCNLEDELACKAFWHEIEQFSRNSLIVQLDYYGAGWLYDTWSNAFWRKDSEVISYRKIMRFWDKRPGELMGLRKKYDIEPWRNVRWGVLYSIPLNTMTIQCEEIRLSCGKLVEGLEKCHVLGMNYDDTWYMLRGIIWMLK
jgi:hypothetical protein